MTFEAQLLEQALAYASEGLAVFPCTGKFPLTEHGVKDATLDAERIKQYWSEHPGANIGIACGKTSGCLVLDVDTKSGGVASLEQIWIDNDSTFADETPEVITGTGGRHFYFKYEDGLRNKVGFKPGLDIRSEGGYVIAPPSRHPDTGKPYEWAMNARKLDTMPEWLRSLIKETPVERSERAGEAGAVGKGGRNDYLTRVAGSMQRRGISSEAILAALTTENETQCTPPLPMAEVQRIADSVGRYAPTESLIPEPEQPRQDSLTDGNSGGGLIKASDLIQSTFSYLNDKAKVKGTPTGLDGLDKLLGGGRRLGEVTCWHAEAKTGKNTLWHYLMYLWLELGIPIAYASRELSPDEEVIPNLLSVAVGENAWLSEITPERKAQFDAAMAAWPLYFSEGYGYFPVEQIREFVERGIEAGIQHFFFDHLHYMLQDPEDHKAASHLIKDLKALAKTRKIHIDVIIQPNKLMDGQRLSLNSIKGGAAMGQAIDNLLILERVKREGVKNVSKLTLEVARSKLCKPGHLFLQFDPDSTRFVETEPETEENGPTRATEVPEESTQLISDDIPVADRGKNRNFVHQPFKVLV